jgi:hypothetical protein
LALSGLSPGTLYHYLVKSRNAAGNLATSGDFTFTITPREPPALQLFCPRLQSSIVFGQIASGRVGDKT